MKEEFYFYNVKLKFQTANIVKSDIYDKNKWTNCSHMFDRYKLYFDSLDFQKIKLKIFLKRH